MDPGRLIIDGAGIGSWNMAVDQALLQNCEATGEIVLRFYRWEPATLSLGYFQSFSQRENHPSSTDSDCVRRVTGGGAIMHDQEITYSLVIPSSQRWSTKNEELYSIVHRCIIESLQSFGVETTICLNSDKQLAHRFLCFERRTDGDLLLGTDKVGGSAQRRSRNSLLQHGSLLMRQSRFAPELPGIHDLVSTNIDDMKLIHTWSNQLSKHLKIDWSESEYQAHELEAANLFRQSKFATDRWNKKR